MARRIARDAVVQIALGGFDDGSAITWSADQTITGIARSVSIRESAPEVNLAGLGEIAGRMRMAGPATRTMTIEGFNPGNSFYFYVGGTTSPVGYRARVKVKPHSALTAAYEFDGVITRFEWSAQTGEPQVETIEIAGPLDTTG